MSAPHPYALEPVPDAPEVRPAHHVGQRLRRKEDDRLIRGRGRHVGDIHLHDTLHVAVLRSPFAHATIGSIDASRALQHPGVVTVVTREDLEGKVGPLKGSA